ncbi:MAG TPA: LLM class flavin-dependent oxidoreductase [Polyangia bacterium]|nr:LLM class flavin-dependent oxidoreductase [Polyangia bacterium]
MPAKSPRRELILNTFFMRFGHHPAAWRHPSAVGNGRPDVDYWVKLAVLAEKAKLHTFFLADFIGRSANDLEAQSHMGVAFQFEPISLLSLVAAHTRHIGLVATVNTNFEHPYNVARMFASLDHVSGGRAGWNVVSSLSEATARNFGLERPFTHAERYERAAEFVTLAKKLWDSWDDDAFDRPDRASGRFFEPAAAHPVNHRGKWFGSEGLLDIARPIQGYPVLVQAGNSDTGREFAAEIAEMIYASAQSLDVAQAYYRDVKGRMARYGREPDHLKITPGLSVVVGKTDQEARDKFDNLQSMVDFARGLLLFGIDVSKLDLDGPLPDDLPEPENGKGRMKQLKELARRENLTVRQLVLRFGVARGHLQVIGSPSRVADVIEEWFTQEGADGFNVVPPLLPGGFEDFVELVVPELQRRGLFHREYTGRTYRENLGLPRPELARAARRSAPQAAAGSAVAQLT